MTFTTTPPTVPGFYAWRLFTKDIPNSCWVTSDGETFWRDGKYPATNGEWCRLVPAEEIEITARASPPHNGKGGVVNHKKAIRFGVALSFLAMSNVCGHFSQVVSACLCSLLAGLALFHALITKEEV